MSSLFCLALHELSIRICVLGASISHLCCVSTLLRSSMHYPAHSALFAWLFVGA